jgi:hypothetical protein
LSQAPEKCRKICIVPHSLILLPNLMEKICNKWNGWVFVTLPPTCAVFLWHKWTWGVPQQGPLPKSHQHSQSTHEGPYYTRDRNDDQHYRWTTNIMYSHPVILSQEDSCPQEEAKTGFTLCCQHKSFSIAWVDFVNYSTSLEAPLSRCCLSLKDYHHNCMQVWHWVAGNHDQHSVEVCHIFLYYVFFFPVALVCDNSNN